MTQVELVLRLALGIVFFVAAIMKLHDPTPFRRAVLEYGILPRELAKIYGVLLPLVEFGTAVLLLSGLLPLVAVSSAALMLTSFSLAMVAATKRKRRVPCFCFGASGRKVQAGWYLIVRDLVLLFPTLWLLKAISTEHFTLISRYQSRVSTLIPLFVVSLCLGLLYIFVDQGFALLIGRSE